MMDKIIDGKKISAEIMREVEAEVKALKGKAPGLAFLLVGENPASKSYVRAKKKACASTGITSALFEFPTSIAESDLVSQIQRLNHDRSIDGILVQLPLPSHIDEKRIMLSIDPRKDVDGFHPLNVGKMLLGDDSGLLPCTPHGIKVLLERSCIPVDGKHVVIVGRSNVVGKPLAAILMQKREGCNATVTICHSRSEQLSEISKSADILVAAIGRAGFIRANMVKPGAAVIDVGINRVEGKIVGDVDFGAVLPIAGRITPSAP
jgi:methylenetetrahydrofolate dehydrogenase (NADP+)/methenyltetrahydrofolate cyclohydrolase